MPRQLLLGFATIRTNAQLLPNIQRSHFRIVQDVLDYVSRSHSLGCCESAIDDQRLSGDVACTTKVFHTCLKLVYQKTKGYCWRTLTEVTSSQYQYGSIKEKEGNLFANTLREQNPRLVLVCSLPLTLMLPSYKSDQH